MLKAAENAELVFQSARLMLMTFGNKFRRSLDHIGPHPVAEGGIGHYPSITSIMLLGSKIKSPVKRIITYVSGYMRSGSFDI